MSPYDLKTDFYTEVLTESQKTPILVDFWATWCGPCRVLSPILEKLAAEARGAWKLVKVNTETNPEIAGHYGIQVIPTVLLFDQGNPVAEFQGALPEAHVREWLKKNVTAGPAPAAEGKEAAVAALEAGHRDEAKAILKQAIEKDPKDGESRILLARILFREDPKAAAHALEPITEEDAEHDTAVQIRRLGDLVELGRKPERASIQGPKEDVEHYLEGASLLAKGDYRGALERWIALVEKNRALDDDGARKACVALFALLGGESPLTQEYRRKLSVLLY